MHCRTIQSNKIVGDQNSRKMLYSACRCFLHSGIYVFAAFRIDENPESSNRRRRRLVGSDFHSESEIGEEFSASLTSRSVSADVRRVAHDQAADTNLALNFSFNFSRKLFENDYPGAFWTTLIRNLIVKSGSLPFRRKENNQHQFFRRRKGGDMEN